MAAPKGNKFWKLRSKHGREKLFASPELLWQAACEYFEWCGKNPWQKNDFVSGGPKAGTIVKLDVERPMSINALCIYLDCNKGYFIDFKNGLTGKNDELAKDFSEVISRIEDIIETQQFEGATVGTFNANIISRKLGLIDKTEAKTETKFTGLQIRVIDAGKPPKTSEKDAG